jgi:uncharacterized protein YbgA (DUF1722 family)/uncharacterized protein YbbK (DUF523 family)
MYNPFMTLETAIIKVGISSCLLGETVRYDGGHKRSNLCTDQLSRYFEFVSTCPELGADLGVPRPPIRLNGDPAAPRAVRVIDNSIDVTDQLLAYSAKRVPELQAICGYIFIRNSPSCGLFGVKVYQHEDRPPVEKGRGIFAQVLTSAMPLLPVEEDGRLQDPALRENFITRVFALHNWRQLLAEGLTAMRLFDFHARYKYTLMAHNPQEYGRLGRMLAGADKHDGALGDRYFAALMQALQSKATRGTTTNVLMHLQGYLKKQLQAGEKKSLAEVIEQYHKGLVPLSVPVTLLRHLFARYPDPYIARQTFLQPYPGEPGQEGDNL